MANVLEMLVKLQDDASAKLSVINDKIVDIDKSARESTKGFDIMGKKFQDIGVKMLATGGAIIGLMYKMTSDWGKSGEELLNLSKKTGMAVKSLSELGILFKNNGISADSLEVAIRQMNNVLVDAEDETSIASKAFKKLGLNFKDLKAMKPEERFWKIANAIAGLEDPAERSAMAVDLFGRSGTDLLPIIDMGTEAINEQIDAIRKSGAVMDEEGATKAAKFDDAIDQLQTSLKGLTDAISSMLAGPLGQFITWLTNVVNGFNDWISKHKELEGILTAAFIGAGILAVGGGVMIALGQILLAFKNISLIMGTLTSTTIPGLTSALGTSSSGLLGALGAVGLALFDIYIWYQNIKQIAENWDLWKQSPYQTFKDYFSSPSVTKEQVAKLNKLSYDQWMQIIPTLTEDQIKRYKKAGVNIPGFAAGGIVPGPIGQPTPIMAHGGEMFLGAHNQLLGNTSVNVNVGVLSGDQGALRRLAKEIKRVVGEDNRRTQFGTLGQLDISYRNAP